MPEPERELTASDWVGASLEEYKTLREESLGALDRQLGIIRFGVALIAALIALGLRARHEDYIGSLVLAGFVPLAVFLVLLLWLAEVERSVRAGAFVAAIECKLGVSYPYGPPPLGWERWLRGLGRPSPGSEGTEKEVPAAEQFPALLRLIVTFGVFMLPAGAAAFLGNYTLATCEKGDLMPSGHCYPDLLYGLIAGDAIAFLLLAALAIYSYQKVKDRRRPPSVDDAWPTAVADPAGPIGERAG